MSKEHEQSFIIKNLLNAMPCGVGIFVFAKTLLCEYYSDGFARMAGLSREEIDARLADNTLLSSLIAPMDYPHIGRLLAEQTALGLPLNLTYRYLYSDGSIRWLHLSAEKMDEQDGYPAYYCVFTNPPEEASLYQSIVEESAGGVFVAERETRNILYKNAAADLLCGFDAASDGIGYSVLEHLKKQNKKPLLSEQEIAALRFDRYSEFHKERGRFYLTVKAKALLWNGIDSYILYISDETTEHLSQMELQNLINEVPGGIGIYDIDHGIAKLTYLNDAYYEMLGFTRKELETTFGEQAFYAIHEEDRPAALAAIASLVSGEERSDTLYRIRNHAGCWIWLSLSARVVSRNGAHLKVYATFTDCNELVTSRQELQTGRITLETALQVARVMSWKYDYRQKRITDSLTLGEAFQLPKVIEHVPESIVNMGFVSPNSVSDFCALFEELTAETTKQADVESTVTDERGSVWYRLIYTPVFDTGGIYKEHIGIAIDITDQKIKEQEYEDQLHLSKMSNMDAIATASYNLTQNKVTEFETSAPELKDFSKFTTANEMLQGTRGLVLDPEEQEQFQVIQDCRTLIEAFGSGTTHIELKHHLNDPSRWFQSNFDMLENPYTGDIEVISTLHDVTDTVQAELIVSKLLEVDYQSILVLNPSTGFVSPFSRNKKHTALTDLFQMQSEHHSSLNDIEAFLKQYIIPDMTEKTLRETALPYVRQQLEEAPFYECICGLLLQGKKNYYRIIYAYLDHNRGVLLAAIQDITEIFEQEEQQKAELSKALEDAKKANRAKTDFMSRMSHDMRTPMNAIMGLAALTLDDAKNPTAVRENMGKMREASNFLLGLVNDILDMAKIEDGSVKLHYEPYRYSDFLMNMKTMFLPQCEAKGISIRFVEPIHIDPVGLTDKIRLNQIFFNVFSNAVKYTPTGGRIDSHVEHVKKDQHSISADYVITDTGIGMSEEFQKHLFQPFMQEDSSVTPELQGSGLGLSITKQLVELMGGRIQIKSKKGVGTTVIISLSFELSESVPEDPACSGLELSEAASLIGKRVLLVEDHPLNAQIARRLLEKEQMVVAYAENGRVAVEKFKISDPHTFDVILMDIRMPELSGYEATRAIRQLDRADAKQIPIIAMSANAYPEDMEKGIACGMTDYLTKPVEPKKLYESLKKYL